MLRSFFYTFMNPDFEAHMRKLRSSLADFMNQTSADFGSPYRIRADGTSYYDYSSISDDQILDDVGGTFISEEQRHEATRAIISRLDGAVLGLLHKVDTLLPKQLTKDRIKI
ncbi:hypothetical protein HYT02_04305 [Candidatus Gottesmanbacteria bacterium]|nr:hypothetical protein [Candidatus Gottesmanbacteria bacterium]